MICLEKLQDTQTHLTNIVSLLKTPLDIAFLTKLGIDNKFEILGLTIVAKKLLSYPSSTVDQLVWYFHMTERFLGSP